jgi:ribosomal protein S3AE
MPPTDLFILLFAITAAFLIFALIVIAWSYYQLRSLRASYRELELDRNKIRTFAAVHSNEFANREKDLRQQLAQYAGIADAEAEKSRILNDAETEGSRLLYEARRQESEILAGARVELSKLMTETAAYDKGLEERRLVAKDLENQIIRFNKEMEHLGPSIELHSFGFYEAHYDFDTPDAYKMRLEAVRSEIKRMIQEKKAAISDATITVNGSLAEGRKQTNQTLKLMLRAFNGESDACIAKVKYSNVRVMEDRIRSAYERINSLVTVQQCYLSNDYLNLKLQELYLVHEWREKEQMAKEEQRAIRARMRDDEIARREIEKALAEAARDEAKYNEALENARLEAETAAGARHDKLLIHIGNLERKLAEAMTQKERAMSRAQMTRSGHVYVISNLGSFGEDVYKIGMTRRLDPMDRVLELGDASVPFRFDVHAIIYCDDAPDLECKLHNKFEKRRINRVNFRKEFFKVSLDEIAAAVKEFHGHIEFTMAAQAEEYRKTLAALHAGSDETKPSFEPIAVNSSSDMEVLADLLE